MWQTLHDTWWRLATQSHPRTFLDTLACGALQTCSVAYRALVAIRHAAYDRGWVGQTRLPCRVVSVGNLTVGGTGKTTCVELIAQKLTVRGRRVAVLSRGYGGARRDYWLRWEGSPAGKDGGGSGRMVVNGHAETDLRGVADEPQLLARHLAGIPVVVGAQRVRTGQLAATTLQADTVVLDDGFQHRRLRRDCDILLLHARMPAGGWPMLPRGPMREPIDAIKRAHIIIVTKADEALEAGDVLRTRLHELNPHAVWVTAMHEAVALQDGFTGDHAALDRLKGWRVGLLSSIGDPQGFATTVRRLDAKVIWHRAFPDHHPYRVADWLSVLGRIETDRLDALVTTEKDWVRLEPILARADTSCPVPLWMVKIRMKLLSGEEAFDDRLARMYAR